MVVKGLAAGLLVLAALTVPAAAHAQGAEQVDYRYDFRSDFVVPDGSGTTTFDEASGGFDTEVTTTRLEPLTRYTIFVQGAVGAERFAVCSYTTDAMGAGGCQAQDQQLPTFERIVSFITGPQGGVVPMPPFELQEQAPPLEADRSTDDDDEVADGEIEAAAAQTAPQEGDDPSEDGGTAGEGAQDGGSEVGDRNCDDFSSQEEAQDFFEEQGGPEDDPNVLDADDDGEACETFFASGGSVPTGGVDAGVAEAGRPVADRAGPAVAGGLLMAALLVLTVGLGRPTR